MLTPYQPLAMSAPQIVNNGYLYLHLAAAAATHTEVYYAKLQRRWLDCGLYHQR